MNGIRQALALCVWLVAVRYIAEKRFWTYLALCIASSMFHYSAAILIILYPILRNSKDYFKSIKLQLLLLGVAFLIQSYFLFLLPKTEILLDVYKTLLGGGKAYGKTYGIEGLKNSYIESEGTNLVYYSKIIINIIIIFYSQKLKDFYDTNKFTIIYFLFFIGLITSYMFPIGYISVTRPFRYFYIFETIMYAYFAYYLIKNKTPQNQVLFLILIVLFIGVFLSSIAVASEDSHLIYQFFFDQD
ncbi:EpsG family protein [Brumimicrobium salinarum]|nr:EpsG family protein [Brumimicrobium salinarum]